MDMSKEQQIRRLLADAAAAKGFEMPPNGMRIVIPEEGNDMVAEVVFIIRGDKIEEAIAEANGTAGQLDDKTVDALFDDIAKGFERDAEREAKREQVEEAVKNVTEEILEQLRDDPDGGFL